MSEDVVKISEKKNTRKSFNKKHFLFPESGNPSKGINNFLVLSLLFVCAPSEAVCRGERGYIERSIGDPGNRPGH